MPPTDPTRSLYSPKSNGFYPDFIRLRCLILPLGTDQLFNRQYSPYDVINFCIPPIPIQNGAKHDTYIIINRKQKLPRLALSHQALHPYARLSAPHTPVCLSVRTPHTHLVHVQTLINIYETKADIITCPRLNTPNLQGPYESLCQCSHPYKFLMNFYTFKWKDS